MFGFFKSDPKKKLEKEYRSILEKAVAAQRNGNIALYAKLSSEADKISKQLDELKKQDS